MTLPTITTAVAGPRRRHSLGRVWPPVAFGIAALLLWELVVAVSGVPAFLLPAPSAIAAQVVAAFPTILATAAVTGGNALVGLVVGFVLGVGLALLAARSPIVSELATPLVSAAAAVPIVALAAGRRGRRRTSPGAPTAAARGSRTRRAARFGRASGGGAAPRRRL